MRIFLYKEKYCSAVQSESLSSIVVLILSDIRKTSLRTSLDRTLHQIPVERGTLLFSHSFGNGQVN